MKVTCNNVGRSGATLEDLLATQVSVFSDFVPDLVTVAIGSNDVLKTPLDEFKVNFLRLLTLLPPGSFVANIPYFGGRVRRLETVVEMSIFMAKAIGQSSHHFVDIYSQTKADQSFRNYAADMFHPNARGYRSWFQAFLNEIEPILKRELIQD